MSFHVFKQQVKYSMLNIDDKELKIIKENRKSNVGILTETKEEIKDKNLDILKSTMETEENFLNKSHNLIDMYNNADNLNLKLISAKKNEEKNSKKNNKDKKISSKKGEI